jgi:hypothetical protein
MALFMKEDLKNGFRFYLSKVLQPDLTPIWRKRSTVISLLQRTYHPV